MRIDCKDRFKDHDPDLKRKGGEPEGEVGVAVVQHNLVVGFYYRVTCLYPSF